MSAWRTWTALSWAAVLFAVGCASAGSSAAPGGATSASAAASTSGSASGEALWLQALQMSTPSTGWALYFAGNPSTAPAGTPTLLARTTDGARSWADVTPPRFTGGTGFLTVGASRGMPALLATRDLGQTWQPVSLPVGYSSSTYPYPQVTFFGPRYGVLVPAAYETMNSGRTWTRFSARPAG